MGLGSLDERSGGPLLGIEQGPVALFPLGSRAKIAPATRAWGDIFL
jgi:hypothetical protein